MLMYFLNFKASSKHTTHPGALWKESTPCSPNPHYLFPEPSVTSTQKYNPRVAASIRRCLNNSHQDAPANGNTQAFIHSLGPQAGSGGKSSSRGLEVRVGIEMPERHHGQTVSIMMGLVQFSPQHSCINCTFP